MMVILIQIYQGSFQNTHRWYMYGSLYNDHAVFKITIYKNKLKNNLLMFAEYQVHEPGT